MGVELSCLVAEVKQLHLFVIKWRTVSVLVGCPYLMHLYHKVEVQNSLAAYVPVLLIISPLRFEKAFCKSIVLSQKSTFALTKLVQQLGLKSMKVNQSEHGSVFFCEVYRSFCSMCSFCS